MTESKEFQDARATSFAALSAKESTKEEWGQHTRDYASVNCYPRFLAKKAHAAIQALEATLDDVFDSGFQSAHQGDSNDQ